MINEGSIYENVCLFFQKDVFKFKLKGLEN